ncbi:MAG: MerC domain-containing protein [Gammaproteobacteria bacterium]|nr:MerC domain-containing protein [Gammaproteobacteria bacterium]MBT5406730.1 MerC domain-containing protein [Gammaproteobacteria bacterium]MBT6733696.1 MerC domain-containing protein [Gammaproteobacteria bacterium]
MQRILDNFGLTISAACAIHCILLPILLILSPYIELTFFTSHGFHESLMYFILPTSVIAFTLGCKRHNDDMVKLGGICGIFVLLIAIALHEFSEPLSIILTLFASSLLIFTHLRNRTLCSNHDYSCHK